MHLRLVTDGADCIERGHHAAAAVIVQCGDAHLKTGIAKEMANTVWPWATISATIFSSSGTDQRSSQVCFATAL